MNICLKTSARHVVAAVLEIYSDLTVRQTLTASKSPSSSDISLGEAEYTLS